jgi:hypothetical protein
MKDKYYKCAECNKKVTSPGSRKDGCFVTDRIINIDKGMPIKVLCKGCMKIYMVRHNK